MKDPRQTIHYIANLARIELNPEEETLFAPQFQKIIGYIDKLNTLATDAAVPAYSVIALKNVLREDVPEHKEAYKKIIENFPQKEGNFCKVPRVIE